MASHSRILLVDDHALFRASIRALLRIEPGFEIVGEASNGPDAVRSAAELSPDLIIMDVEMPGAFDGIEATRQILAGELGQTRVIGVSAVEWHEAAMRGAGAVAFVPKARAAELIEVIHASR